MPRLFRRKPKEDDEYEEIPSDAEFSMEDVKPSDDALLPYTDEPLVPFVPVESEHDFTFEPYDIPGSEDDEYAEEDLAPVEPIHRPRTRRFRLSRPQIARHEVRRPRSPVQIQFGALFLVLSLIALGIFGTLLNRDQITGDVQDWWPAAIIAVAVLWMLAALVQRRIPAFLGAAGLAGIGISLLMDTQSVASVNETLLGLVLVTLGFGIVVRGFVLRQETYS
ncbi:hypothetical protein [Aggregatilinea lenta]|uniref:hypothetical protein n=1 Tax=Aggregatilinea lenta TaxID=913108 RepID=UPI000E5B4987|nr:hypothetical protein [Aggregatilinea lenta]